MKSMKKQTKKLRKSTANVYITTEVDENTGVLNTTATAQIDGVVTEITYHSTGGGTPQSALRRALNALAAAL